MSDFDKLLRQMRASTKNVRFSDLEKICEHFFGPSRNQGSSHCVYKTPWQGNPRINIQKMKGKAKPYQVRQVLDAIARLEVEREKSQ